MSAPARLLLVPAPLEQTDAPHPWLLPADLARLRPIGTWFVETPKTARHWMRHLGLARPIAELRIDALPQAAAPAHWHALLQPLLDGHDAALMSDAGCPGVADPGANLVAAAHAAGIVVEPLVGPSSILLALMASGLQGQRFTFHGYLPIERAARAAAITTLARHSREQAATQIVIETPFRNDALFDALLQHLPKAARLCVAQGLDGPGQTVRTRTVADWARARPAQWPRVPAVFLFDASEARSG